MPWHVWFTLHDFSLDFGSSLLSTCFARLKAALKNRVADFPTTVFKPGYNCDHVDRLAVSDQ